MSPGIDFRGGMSGALAGHIRKRPLPIGRLRLYYHFRDPGKIHRMRPVPRSRHLVALAIFVAVAGLYGYLASVDYRMDDEQFHLATSALKRQHPDLLAADLMYGRSRMWQAHPPIFLAILETILSPSGYRDLTLPFRVLVGVFTLVYLCGMYALLRRQCRSWSVSAFVAVLSSAVTRALGESYWGIGSLGSITPVGLCVALMPLVVLAFLKYADQWRVLLVFAAVGGLGNLHVPTAVNLTVVLLIVYLARRRFGMSAWPMAVGCALCAAAAAAPYAWYYLALRRSIMLAGLTVGSLQAVTAVEIAASAGAYPPGELMKPVVNWLLQISVPAIVSVVVLSRVERFRVRDLGFWLALAAGSLLVAFVGYGVAYLVSLFREVPGPSPDALEATKVAMLPLYALLAQSITNLFRMLRSHRALVRWGCVALAAAWMMPSDNVRVLRHAALGTATMFMDEADKPGNVQRHHERDNRQRELVAIADWARTESDPSAVFITDRIEFRMMARRSILLGEDDASYIYRLAPKELPQWQRWILRQHLLLHGPQAGDPQALAALVGELTGQRHFKAVRQWFVMLPAAAPKNADPKKEIDPEKKWGACYKLYRLR